MKGPLEDFHPDRIKALAQAAAVLDALAQEPEQSVGALARTLGVSAQALHKIFLNLQAAGLVELSPTSGHYRLGMRLWELGSRAVSGRRLFEEALPELGRLSEATRLPAMLAVPTGHGGRVVYVEQLRQDAPEEGIGRSFPAHATALGKAILAALPSSHLRAAIAESALTRFTPKTITEAKVLDAELERVRERGFAIEDEEWSVGLRALGAVVRDHTDQAVAAIGVGRAIAELPDERIDELGVQVAQAAGALSRRLGAGQSDRLSPRPVSVRERGRAEDERPPAASDAERATTGTAEPTAPREKQASRRSDG